LNWSASAFCRISLHNMELYVTFMIDLSDRYFATDSMVVLLPDPAQASTMTLSPDFICSKMTCCSSLIGLSSATTDMMLMFEFINIIQIICRDAFILYVCSSYSIICR
jgi:hypothetical protein